MNNTARMFPRKTKVPPDDAPAFFGGPPPDGLAKIDEVHFSVTFTYDFPEAERLAELWRAVGVLIKPGGSGGAGQ